jgi:hypothetical protein
MPEIQRLSVRHDAIMDFLMANPCIKLGDVAAHFSLTQAWLSQVIHSDAFQTRLREKQHIAFHHTVLPLREKMQNIAHMALDKLAEDLPRESDMKTVLATADSVLDKLGFGSKNATTAPAQHLHLHVLKEEVEEARALLYKSTPQTNLIPVLINGRETPFALPPESFTEVGEAADESALPPIEAELGSSSARAEV